MRTKWLTMDLGEDEDFAFQHPYFFENFTFKFEGLPAEIQKEFENTVTSMSATVSDDAEYKLTDFLYTPASDPTKNYYSVSYLSDSILAEEPLDIENYKFSNMIESTNYPNFCCASAKYIWRTESCKSYFNRNFCCKSCIDKIMKESKDLGLNQVNGKSNDSSINNINKESQRLHINTSNGTINTSQCDKSNEKENNVSFVEHEIDDVNLDENSNDSTVQPQANGNSQENGINICNNDSNYIEMTDIQKDVDVEKRICSMPKSKASKTKKKSSIDRWKKRKNSSRESDAEPQANGKSQKNGVDDNKSDSSDIEMIKIQNDIDVEKPSCSTQKPTLSKIKNKSSIDRWKKRKNSFSESDSSSESEDLKKRNRKNKKKRQRVSSSSSEETITTAKPTSDSEFIVDSEKVSNSEETRISKSPSKSSSDEEPGITRTSLRRNKWWLKLPEPNKRSNKQNNIRSKRDYDYAEKKIMIAYLVTKDMIHNATSRKPWQSLIDDGYSARTVESLNNHFRKSILPNIESYRLPKDIEKKFIQCRRLH